MDEVQPERVKLSLRLSQSKPLYEAFKGIKDGDLWGQLSEAQQRIVDGELRDFVLGGVALEVSLCLTLQFIDMSAALSAVCNLSKAQHSSLANNMSGYQKALYSQALCICLNAGYQATMASGDVCNQLPHMHTGQV